MMRHIGIFVLLWFALSAPAFSQSKKIDSLYTELSEKACRTLELTPEGGGYRGLCGGVGGFKLELIEGDLRQSLNIIAPNGKKFELNLWSVAGGGFSALGDRAEWRVSGGVPFALIVRHNVSTDADKPEKRVSYLIVARISRDSACVTDLVPPSADQNARARQLADGSTAKECMTF